MNFTNTSTGIGSGATFQWDFGNGNTSVQKNPAAVYEDPQTYTVKLTVTDGGLSSVISKTVVVYKKPTADFVISGVKGCAPYSVDLSVSATPGDGSISRYTWDYGDGITEVLTGATAKHTYTSDLRASLSVTVENSYGCYVTVEKKDLVQILPEMRAIFAPATNFICRLSEPVTLTNSSIGPGTLTYQWDFGDGQVSSDKDPQHYFSKAGTYSVSLTVRNDLGCEVKSTNTNALNVANFSSAIAEPSQYCYQALHELKNQSFPVPTSYSWFVNDVPMYQWTPGPLMFQPGLEGNYKIRLINSFGACQDTLDKYIPIVKNIKVDGFLIELKDRCASPMLYSFKDTSVGAVSWQWVVNPGGIGTTREVQIPVDLTGRALATLRLKDAKGCTIYLEKYFDARRPGGTVHYNGSFSEDWAELCGPGDVQVQLRTLDTIVKYFWNAGNGQTSTDASPVFRYTKPGDYFPEVTVTTSEGCTYTTKSRYSVIMRDSIRAGFITASDTICGNTPTVFTDKSFIPQGTSYAYWGWNVNDGSEWLAYERDQQLNYILQFRDSGTVKLRYLVGDGVCSDTATRYLKILPPLPDIKSIEHSCDGNQGTVTFNYDAGYAISGIWDWGDGTTSPLVPGNKQEKHTYNKTGIYKVFLTATNGNCVVKDSIIANALLKQKPVLLVDKTEICYQANQQYASNMITLTITNLERTPVIGSINSGDNFEGYSTYTLLNQDGKNIYSNGNIKYINDEKTHYEISRWDFSEPVEELRVVVRSSIGGCWDTSNAVKVRIKGPIAAFGERPLACDNGNSISLMDSSKETFGNKIVKWEWFHDISQPPTVQTSSGSFIYSYPTPGFRYVQLKVTDAAGCTSTAFISRYIENTSLKAVFEPSAVEVSPGSTVRFTNKSLSSDPVNTTYQWWFGDGTGSNNADPDKQFNTPGTYNVQLIIRNTAKGCTDTASVKILVRYVNAAFSINSTYLTNANCPPVKLQFNNTSANIQKIKWDFGDGATSVQFNPSHIYTIPGIYVVRVETFSDNGTRYLATDTVRIAAPVASFTGDSLQGCAALHVNFKASVLHGINYAWDFGDGTVQTSTDSSIQYVYTKAGVYQPRLVVRDINGCSVSSKLNALVRVDSLVVGLASLPAQLCAPKTLTLSANVFAAAGQSFQYHWRFSAAPGDTSSLATPVYTFSQAGTYPVQLTVKASSGCVRTVSKEIVAFQGLGAAINGPGQICQKQRVNFTAITSTPGTPQYQWTFPDGTQYDVANPPAYAFNTAGTFNIRLVVSNSGCNDTIIKKVVVDAIPDKMLPLQAATTCKGTGLGIQAFGGVRYEWTSVPGLQQTTGSDVTLIGVEDVTVRVRGWTPLGCEIRDSVNVKVIQPQNLALDAQISSCAGVPVTLKASGTDQYKWIGNTNGLSAIDIAQPVARLNATTRFTVVGNDAAKCFADTATIEVLIFPAPQVNAGPDAEVSVGGSWSLSPQVSNDVRKYQWSPDKYLSCTSCLSPISTPLEDVTYILMVTNDKGCTAKDTVSIAVLCNESKIYIPNAFTPNGDGNNDRFTLKGSGIKTVKSLRIFDRFGSLIFEKKNFAVNDPSAAWDGKVKGVLVPVGTYVYLAELSCDTKSFVRKGSVTVLY